MFGFSKIRATKQELIAIQIALQVHIKELEERNAKLELALIGAYKWMTEHGYQLPKKD